MKKGFFAALLTLFSSHLFAQDGPLKKGDLKFNAGLGIGSYIKMTGGETTFPPLTISGEYAIQPNITVGPVVGYTATQDRQYYPSINYTSVYKLSNLLVGGNVKYYFDVDSKFDVYAGAFLGYNAVSISVESKSTSSTASLYGLDDSYNEGAGGFLYGVEVGGRYKFSNNLAAFAELGYGIALLNVGFTFSLSKK